MTPSRVWVRYKKVLFTVLVFVCCNGMIPGSGDATDRSDTESPRRRAVSEGTLLLHRDGSSETVNAPVLNTTVKIHVTGLIARASVHQEFMNPGTAWVEGVYVFPLPDTAVVDHLRMRIGERVIEGAIQERAEAKKTYTRAKERGQRASLLEQERPNVFTASVANIPPGERIIVEIEYQETLRYEQGRVGLRFPMVVGPRYVPGSPNLAEAGAQSGMGWSPDTDRVPDASRITPPVLHPSKGSINPLSLTVELSAGFSLGPVESVSHPITLTSLSDDRVQITLKEGTVYADRDFELSWRAADGSAPDAAAFTERVGDETYLLIMLVPPTVLEKASVGTPREVVFVIDTSGSMHGDSINQAKAALRLALTRLTAQDSFNVIQFNDVAHRLFTQSLAATPDTLMRAQRYVDKLAANGGTEMLPALKMALDGQEHHGRLRQVVFLTDGQIGNEEELLREIGARLGDSRLFTVGIGSAPNSFFMRKAAEFGRGSFTYIGNTGQVQEIMDQLFRKLEQPATTDIALDPTGWKGSEFFPARIPDLYVGEPVVLAAKVSRPPERALLTGRVGDTSWRKEIPLGAARDSPGVAVYWARQKIAALMDGQRRGPEQNAARQAVIDVAVRHHLVSKYTSLVAVDVTPIRPQDAALASHALKTNLPHGQDYEHIFGLPRTASPAMMHILFGLVALLSAAACYRLRRFAA